MEEEKKEEVVETPVVPTQEEKDENYKKLKKSNNRKKAFIIILLFVLVLAGLIIFIFFNDKKEEPKKEENKQQEKQEEKKQETEEEIKKSRQDSMRNTADQLVKATRTVLESNYEFFPGTYAFSTGILESGGVTAPFGGKYVYYEPKDTDKKIGSGVYKVEDKELTEEVCKASTYSYIVITRDDTGAYKSSICLNTSNNGEDGGYLMGTSEQLTSGTDTTIFYGKAK